MKKILPILFFFALSFFAKAQITSYSNAAKNTFYGIGGYSFSQGLFQGGVRPNPDVVSGPSPQNDFSYTVSADGGIQHVYTYISTLTINKSIRFEFKGNNIRKFGCQALAVNLITATGTTEPIIFLATTNLGNSATQNATLTEFVGFNVSSAGENEYIVSVVATFVNPSTNSIAINNITIGDNTPQKVALNFDGVDDCITIPASVGNFSTDQNFTVTCWFRPDASVTTEQNLINKWNGSGGYAFTIRYYGNNGTILAGQYDGTNFPYAQSTTNLKDGKWHHVAFVREGGSGTAGTFKLYIDGTQEGGNITDSAPLPTTNLTLLQFGREATNTKYYKGDLDEIKIWSIAKTEAEILSERGCKLSYTANLVAGFDFNEGTAFGNNILITQVNNYTGSNHGTIFNMSKQGNTSNFVTGKIIYAKPTATGNGDGSLWANAFALRTLTGGLNPAYCLTDVEIWVATGIHKPSTNSVTVPFNIATGIQIYGGFAGTETSINQRIKALIHSTNKTTLSGDLFGDDNAFDFSSNRSDNSNIVVNISGNDVVFDGFTVTSTYTIGYGVNLSGTNGFIRNCKLIDNAYSVRSSGENNSIANCSMMGNRYNGIVINNSTVNIKESLIANNGNAGIYINVDAGTRQTTITNCTIASNGFYGMVAVTCGSCSSNNAIKNTIIYNNANTGIDIGSANSSNTITNSLVQGETSTANGNLLGTTNPQFVSPLASNVRSDAGDYHLKDSSPCINVGTDVGVSPFDLDRNLRPKGGKTDMGAYESNINLNEIISKATGNWETNNTWNLERIPLPTDKVILNGHQVTVTTPNARAKDLEYKAGAILRYLAGGLLRFGL